MYHHFKAEKYTERDIRKEADDVTKINMRRATGHQTHKWYEATFEDNSKYVDI